MTLSYEAVLRDEETDEIIAKISSNSMEGLEEQLYKLEKAHAREMKTDAMCQEDGCGLTLIKSNNDFMCPLHGNMEFEEELISKCCGWPIDNGFCKRCGENN